MTPGIARWRRQDAAERPPEAAQDAPPDPAPPSAAERVASLLAANRHGRPRDPEGMGGDTWRAWP